MHSDYNGVAFIAIEAGAAWPAWLAEPHANNVFVETAFGAEAPNDFATRVVQRLLQIESRTGTPAQAVIATNGCVDNLTTSARVRVARAITSSMAAAGHGELWLAADESVADSARTELFELAGELCEEHAELCVRVRFAPAQSESGVVSTSPSSLPAADVSSA
jgi:hypothetical protein